MSSTHTTEGQTAMEPARPNGAGKQPDHAANAQWLKDNPAAMPQAGAGRWAVYDRAGHLRGHLAGDGPTRDTRFQAITAPPGDAPIGYGITLHDAGAHLLDTGAVDGGLDAEAGD
ncbi:hypothetical protein GCM10022419_115550 [Nonomuraea rosea]|uniref:Uncharacterized protein n=1 Tax=Nonomuraea rosea TaxID=638574 RepID=A0ABP6ZLN2_9ACTN